MVKIKKGDIFKTKCKYIVIPVNCKGVMGKGLALQAKRTWPAIVAPYTRACNNNMIHPGRWIAVKNETLGAHLILFPTKVHWREKSRIEYIKEGMQRFLSLPKNKLGYIDSVAIPKLGCGEGGLLWRDVKPIILGIVEQMPEINWEIYE